MNSINYQSLLFPFVCRVGRNVGAQEAGFPVTFRARRTAPLTYISIFVEAYSSLLRSIQACTSSTEGLS